MLTAGEQGGVILDAGRMSYGTGARQNFGAHHHRKSSRRTNPYTMVGGVFVACLMLGCAWTVYANVFGASVFPDAIVGNFDVAVIKRSPAPAVPSAAPAFDDVFAALSAPAPLSSAPVNLTLGPSLTFSDRFAAASPQGEAPRPQPVSPPADRQVAALTPTPPPSPDRQVGQMALLPVPRPADAGPAAGPAKNASASVREMTQSAKAAVLAAVAEKEGPTIFEKLFGKLKSSGSTLAYASADASATASIGPTQNSALGGSVPYDRSTAVYDISARTVYMPDGTKLEAHSGLGSKLDDPKFVHVKMSGATPPHVYDLEPREALFHGVPALRLIPVGGEEAIFGRSGLLAHTYMLGPNGDSNGCVSFKDYNAFLNAYKNGEVKRLAVVSRLD
jgi:hypothetical protein